MFSKRTVSKVFTMYDLHTLIIPASVIFTRVLKRLWKTVTRLLSRQLDQIPESVGRFGARRVSLTRLRRGLSIGKNVLTAPNSPAVNELVSVVQSIKSPRF